MSKNKKKNSIFLHVLPNIKDEVFTVNKTNIEKRLPCEFGIFFVLKVNEYGNPIAILNSYVGSLQKNKPMEDGKIVPFFFLIPFTMNENQYFKCDNCDVTGQNRGYFMTLDTNVPYTFCPICTEGM